MRFFDGHPYAIKAARLRHDRTRAGDKYNPHSQGIFKRSPSAVGEDRVGWGPVATALGSPHRIDLQIALGKIGEQVG